MIPEAQHRPWPLPNRPWVLSMQWHDLLFMHWPVAPRALRPLIPPGLEIDTFDGAAWVGVVPFVMRRVRPRFLPAVPWLSQFPELNVRTYVYTRGAGDRTRGKPGVWFFSLDARQPVAVRLARWTFHLPYFDARMAAATDTGGTVRYVSRRTHRGDSWGDVFSHSRGTEAVLRARYRPTGPPREAERGSLARWLTERYCLYAATNSGLLYRGEIHHRPWPLQPAEGQVEANTMTSGLGFNLPADRKPHLRFARRLDVRAWAPRRVETE